MNRFLYTSIALTIFALYYTSPLMAREKTFTVVIDAGHGGKDSGAKGSRTNEKTINLAVAKKLGNMIAAGHDDVKVIYTRKTDKFVELNERANIANRNKADLFISIHTNSIKKGKTAKGAETYTLGLARTEENLKVAMLENSAILLEDDYIQKYEGFDPNSSESYIIFEFMQNKHVEQSVSFASEIQKEFTSAKRVNRGVRQAGFLVLKATGMPSVLIELGFISNKEEERYMHSTAGQNKLAKAIYKAFSRYKKDYVRKQGGFSTKHTTDKKENKSIPISDSIKETAGEIVYKVQILTSDKQIPLSSGIFKGYDVSCYKDDQSYKYTYGESTDIKEIKKIKKEISKDFKDSFIIRMRDGKRLK